MAGLAALLTLGNKPLYETESVYFANLKTLHVF